MAGKYDYIDDNGIIIGYPWSKTITLPENLSGKTVRWILREQFSDTTLVTYVSPTNITIGTPGATTSISIALSSADTASLSVGIVRYFLRVVDGAEYLSGLISVRA